MGASHADRFACGAPIFAIRPLQMENSIQYGVFRCVQGDECFVHREKDFFRFGIAGIADQLLDGERCGLGIALGHLYVSAFAFILPAI